MRVLLFCSNFPQSYDEAFVSGVVKNAFNQARSLSEIGYEVTVITDGPNRGQWSIEGMQVYGVGKGLFKGVFKAGWIDLKMTTKFLLLGRKHFDIIHIHTGNLVLFFLLKKNWSIKGKVVYTAHGTTSPELKASYAKKVSFKERLVSINGWVQEKIDSFMWHNSDILISSSNYQVQEMRDIYELDPDKIVAIHNGFDEKRYFPDAVAGTKRRQQLNIPKDTPVVLFVGRASRKKGIHLLLNTVETILSKKPDTHFVFVLGELGKQFDVPYVQEINILRDASPYRDRIRFVENVSENDLPSYYQMANLAVFPSQGYESLPTVIYEAMACGVTIITQGSWGTTEVLEKVFLSEEELQDSTILASKIVEILDSPDLQKEIGEKYQSKVADFAWSKIGLKYSELYKI